MIQVLAWPLVVLALGLVAAFLVHRWAGTGKQFADYRVEVSNAMYETGNQIGLLKARAQKLEDDLLNLGQRVA